MQTLLEREQQLSQFGEFGLDPSLVLYVPLYKKDAASFMSEDAYGHLCTKTGALWRPDGYLFDGVDDYTTITSNPAFTQVSIAVWLKPSAFTTGTPFYQPVCSQVLTGRGLSRNRSVTDGASFHMGGDTDGAATRAKWSTSGDNVPHFLVGTYDGRCRLYLDGALHATATNTDTFTNDSGGWDIMGTGAADRQVGGVLSEVWIYSRALNAFEILNIYLSTRWRYQ